MSSHCTTAMDGGQASKPQRTPLGAVAEAVPAAIRTAPDPGSGIQQSLVVEAGVPVDSPFAATAAAFVFPAQQASDAPECTEASPGSVASPFSRVSTSMAAHKLPSNSSRPRATAGPGASMAQASALPPVAWASIPADATPMLRRSASVPFRPPAAATKVSLKALRSNKKNCGLVSAVPICCSGIEDRA